MSETLCYRVDQLDRLVHCEPSFDDFAQQNGAPGRTAGQVVGRPLFDFCANSEVRQLYQAIMNRVREQGRPVVIPFRCDAPNMRSSCSSP